MYICRCSLSLFVLIVHKGPFTDVNSTFSVTGKSVKALLPKRSRSSQPVDKTLLSEACKICDMYNNLLKCFPQVANDLLVGLSCHQSLVIKFWYFIKVALGLDPEHVLKMILAERDSHLSSLLILFCQAAQYLIA